MPLPQSTITSLGLAVSTKEDVLSTSVDKTTPVDGDSLLLKDSEAGGVWKPVFLTNFKTFLQSTFGGLYVGLTGDQTISGVKTFTGDVKISKNNPFVILTDPGDNYTASLYYNDEGGFYVGKERRLGNGLLAGDTGYAGILATNTNKPIQFGINNTLKAQVDSSGIEIYGTEKVGNVTGGNYTTFEPDGTMVAVGAASCYRDEIGAISSLQQTGPGVSYNNTEGTMEFLTSSNLNDYAWVGFQINHDWQAGTTVYPHIHWFQDQNNNPNFLMQYRWQINGGAKVTAWTSVVCNALIHTYVSGTLNQTSDVAAGIPAPVGYALSDIIQIRVYRDNANNSGLFAGADAYTTTVGITSVDIHIKVDMLGSHTEYVK